MVGVAFQGLDGTDVQNVGYIIPSSTALNFLRAIEEAEGCLHRALEIARRHEAKTFELRAATSLARLLREQDRRDEARAELSIVEVASGERGGG